MGSVSVSVSVSSQLGLESEAGLAERLKRRTETRPPSSWEGKWTFLGVMMGVEGSERARQWAGMVRAGEEEEDLSEDLREGLSGLPLERRMGVEVVRGTWGRRERGGHVETERK